MTDLLNCPFCGGEASLTEGGPGNAYVRCMVCQCTGDDGFPDRVVATWNRRSANSAVGGVGVELDVADLRDRSLDLKALAAASNAFGYASPDLGDYVRLQIAIAAYLSSLHPTEGADPVARPSYDAISAMVHACRERQKAAGEGDQMLSRWISEGLDSLYTRSSPVSAEVTEPDEMLVAALKGLVLLKDLFDASDRNQADAYYILAKQDGSWGNARSALASINGGRENG